MDSNSEKLNSILPSNLNYDREKLSENIDLKSQNRYSPSSNFLTKILKLACLATKLKEELRREEKSKQNLKHDV